MLGLAPVSFALASFLLTPALAASGYGLIDTYDSTNFFSKVNFFSDASGDPTHGFVRYVDKGTASQMGLINTDNNMVYLGVDYTNTYSDYGNPTGGRPSVRVSTQQAYHKGLFVLDLAHMPKPVCGSWPAFWSFGPNWPNDGEIDIIENVNIWSNNAMTLHTSDGCTMNSNPGDFMGTGSVSSTDCNAYANYNQGCSVKNTDSLAYGDGFNGNGGGYYVTEWTSDMIRIWTFTHSNAPQDLNSNPNPDAWPQPAATFKSTSSCNIDSKFNPQNFVFDITFCGDWAGETNTFASTCGGKGSCTSYVGNNPGDFKDVNWQINSFKVYQVGQNSSPNLNTGSPSSPSTTSVGSPSTALGTSSSDAPTDAPSDVPSAAPTDNPSNSFPTDTAPADSFPTDGSPSTAMPTAMPTDTDAGFTAPAAAPTDPATGAVGTDPNGFTSTVYVTSPTTITLIDTTITESAAAAATPLAVSPVVAVAIVDPAVVTVVVTSYTTMCPCAPTTTTTLSTVPKLFKREGPHNAHGHVHGHRA